MPVKNRVTSVHQSNFTDDDTLWQKVSEKMTGIAKKRWHKIRSFAHLSVK